MKKVYLIFCENRESCYQGTTENNITKWGKNLDKAKTFESKEEAEKLVAEFKESAMGDTKYIKIVKKLFKK